ncbi:hypothetical protein LBMAG20_18030 [Methylocystaceae bacterium]|nr:hypothetical protein LBMAG20_18030 [Methylocystaceae bacterium]
MVKAGGKFSTKLLELISGLRARLNLCVIFALEILKVDPGLSKTATGIKQTIFSQFCQR